MGAVGCFWTAEEVLRRILCTAYLLACAVQDIQRRKIGLKMSVFAGCAALLLDAAAFFSGQEELLIYAGGLIPGVMLLLLALLSGGAAGTGDGICFMVLGALLGTWMTWILLMYSLLLASVCGAILMLFQKAGRKTRMPFLAFTVAAWVGILTVKLSGINW